MSFDANIQDRKKKKITKGLSAILDLIFLLRYGVCRIFIPFKEREKEKEKSVLCRLL